jgi:tetratricopeptide (TPR) repeat protein
LNHVRKHVLPGLLAFLISVPAAAQEHQHGSGEKLGTVAFTTSCNPAAQFQFNRAVALLHSFEFGRAIEGFGATLKADPSCAMAEWGIAMSRWGNPFGVGIRPATTLRVGSEAVQRARAAGLKTERERRYVEAVAHLFEDAAVSQSARLVEYRDSMAALAAAYPDDPEAAIFHALSIAAVAASSPLDRSFAEPLKAGAILERLLASMPDHPGLAHYVIHSFDYPPLARRALDAARRYGKIAPDSPHARHMPSHTFTRVGYWQESIEANIASAEAARRDGVVGEELHTMDYRIYAYLQTAQDSRARGIVDALPEVAARYDPAGNNGATPPMAAYFAMAAIPARFALERGAWDKAAALVPKPTQYPFAEALTYLARAIGGGHEANRDVVKSSVDALTDITNRLRRQNEAYWAEQTDIQRRQAAAWLAWLDKRPDAALTELRAAAEIEDSTEKSAVTPGPLVPTREMLGEFLLELKRPEEALKEFDATLAREPNRFRSVYGAAKAASLSGDRAKARTYFAQLVKICERADTPARRELTEARQGSQP